MLDPTVTYSILFENQMMHWPIFLSSMDDESSWISSDETSFAKATCKFQRFSCGSSLDLQYFHGADSDILSFCTWNKATTMSVKSKESQSLSDVLTARKRLLFDSADFVTGPESLNEKILCHGCRCLVMNPWCRRLTDLFGFHFAFHYWVFHQNHLFYCGFSGTPLAREMYHCSPNVQHIEHPIDLD